MKDYLGRNVIGEIEIKMGILQEKTLKAVICAAIELYKDGSTPDQIYRIIKKITLPA